MSHIKILKVIFWMNGDGMVLYLPLRTICGTQKREKRRKNHSDNDLSRDVGSAAQVLQVKMANSK